MGERRHTVTLQALESYEQQFKALHKDWHYLYKLVEAYMRPHAERDVLEVDLLRIKGRISCDYPVLAEWRSARASRGTACHRARLGAAIGDDALLSTSLRDLRVDPWPWQLDFGLWHDRLVKHGDL